MPNIGIIAISIHSNRKRNLVAYNTQTNTSLKAGFGGLAYSFLILVWSGAGLIDFFRIDPTRFKLFGFGHKNNGGGCGGVTQSTHFTIEYHISISTFGPKSIYHQNIAHNCMKIF